jgi:hypothetical protein
MTSQIEQKCPDCGGEMEEGFLFERADMALIVSRWMKGVPNDYGTPFFGHGIKLPPPEAECRSIQSFRCRLCGLLKQYALQRVEPPRWGRP